MPTKRNKAGKQQPYVPEGYGDASGEYAENQTGSNVHYTSPDDVKKQLGYTPEQPKRESETPKELSDKLNGEKEKPKDREVTEEMKSIDYTRQFVENGESAGYFGVVKRDAEVKITRGSLTKDEIGVFNNQLKGLFDEYPQMQKFTKINVNNAKASTKGGYIATYGYGKEKSYDLYINAGWLEKTPGERIREENIRFYENKIKELENVSSIENNNEMIERYKNSLDNLKNYQPYNVIVKSGTREDRLKSLMAHELMHRVTQTFYGYDLNKYAGDVEKHNNLNTRYREIQQQIKDAYLNALSNGDAGKISKYATTSRDEFLSEANSQIKMGIETPKYIVDAIESMKEFLRSEK